MPKVDQMVDDQFHATGLIYAYGCRKFRNWLSVDPDKRDACRG